MTYPELIQRFKRDGMNHYQLTRFVVMKPGKTFSHFLEAFARGMRDGDGLSEEESIGRIEKEIAAVIEMRKSELDA